jgi:RimJ/RimL family protein N-acetyltransferase
MRLDCGVCEVRDWERSDKPALLRAANNRNIWRNLTHKFPHPYTEAEADQWFEILERTPVRMHWAIQVDGQAVGGIGAQPGEGRGRGLANHGLRRPSGIGLHADARPARVDARSAHFGYWLSEPYWGRGIMSAACRAVSDLVLRDFDIERLEARVFAWNPASMRVLEKCGFEREGVLRRSVFKDGQVIDAVLYARVRHEPPRRSATRDAEVGQ